MAGSGSGIKSRSSAPTLRRSDDNRCGRIGYPALLLLPALNSVGAEIGKPVAPQTASVGVSTTRFVRNEGAVIRHNMGWTFVLLAYLVAIGIACLGLFPAIAVLPR